MKIIKRSGAEVTFDLEKIIAAICKANNSVKEEDSEFLVLFPRGIHSESH